MQTNSHLNEDLVIVDRLVTFIDGVFAVALTLLVLDLRPPAGSGDLSSSLYNLLPSLLVYLIVFASVAGYWAIHHFMFRHIRRSDGRLVALSLINLLFVTLYPVTASIVGGHPRAPLATVCLSANSLLYCLSAWAVWSHAASIQGPSAEDADLQALRREVRVMQIVAVFLALAIPLAYLSVYLAYADWIVCAPLAAWWGGRK